MSMVVDELQVAPEGAVQRGDVTAGAMFGYATRYVNGVLRSAPRIPADVAAVVAAGADKGDDLVLQGMLRSWPGVDWKAEYLRGHKVAGTKHDGLPDVVRRFPGVDSRALVDMGPEAVDALGAYGTSERKVDEVQEARKLQRRETAEEDRSRTYMLAQFVHDYDVRRKFGLQDVFMQLVLRHAAVDAMKACQVLQRYLADNGFKGVSVQPGKYAEGGKAAKRTLMEAAKPFMAGFVTEGATVVTSRMIMSSPDVVAGHPLWSVDGPLNAADVVVAVWCMVRSLGTGKVAAVFVGELARLGITVIEKAGLTTLAPEPHAGVSLVADVRLKLEPGRFPAAEMAVVPIRDGENVVASAIRLTGGTAVVSAHVRARCSPEWTVDGLRPGGVEEAAPDLWVVSHEVRSYMGPALLSRTPMVGEEAVVVYAVGSGLEVSDPAELLTAATGVMTFSRFGGVRPGCSGGAVLSVEDGALLGVYYGSSNRSSTVMPAGSVFPSRSAMAMTAVDVPVGGGNTLFADMKARGLAPALRGLTDSLVSLKVEGDHAASGLSLPGGTMTTLNPQMWPLTMADGRRAQVVRATKAGYLLQPQGQRYHGRVRAPVMGERVAFLMRTDEDGDVALSDPVVVSLTPTGATTFVAGRPGTSKYPYLGSVAVAVSDGAVVGMFEREVESYAGPRCVCVSVVAAGVSEVSAAAETLVGLVPSLAVGAWPAECVEALVTGDADERTRAMMLGSAYLEASNLMHKVEAAVEMGTGQLTDLVQVLGADGSKEALVELVGAALGQEPVDAIRRCLDDFVVPARPRSWDLGKHSRRSSGVVSPRSVSVEPHGVPPPLHSEKSSSFGFPSMEQVMLKNAVRERQSSMAETMSAVSGSEY